MNKNATAQVLNLLPLVALLVAFSAGAMTVGKLTDTQRNAMNREAYNAMAADKPRNEWTAASLAKAGFRGCEPIDWDAKADPTAPAAVAHVVRTPAAEGYAWVLMSPAEVSERQESFGGTSKTSDDVKMVGNCWA